MANNKITNPFQIQIENPSRDKFKAWLSGLTSEQRIEFEDLRKKVQEEGAEALDESQKALLAGFVHSASLGLFNTLDPKLKKSFDDAKTKFPTAFTSGEVLGFFTPGPAGALNAGTKIGKALSNIVLKPLPKGKFLNALGTSTIEGGAALGALEAAQLDKNIEAFESSIDFTDAFLKRMDKVAESAKVGLLFGAGSTVVANAAKLPFKARQKRIKQIAQELELQNPAFKGITENLTRRTPGVEQLKIARVLNVPKKQADDFFNIFGKEIEDVVAVTNLKGNLEDILRQTKITGTGKTLADKLALQKNNIVQKNNKLISPQDLDDILQPGIERVVEARRFDPELANTMSETLSRLKQRLSKGKLDVKRLSDELNFINKQERRFGKSQQLKEFDKAAVLNEVGKSIRRKLNEKTGGKLNDVNSRIRAMNIINESVGTKRESFKKLTEFRQPSGVFDSLRNLTRIAAESMGMTPRAISDFFGTTSIKEKTLRSFQKQLSEEAKITQRLREGKEIPLTFGEKVTGKVFEPGKIAAGIEAFGEEQPQPERPPEDPSRLNRILQEVPEPEPEAQVLDSEQPSAIQKQPKSRLNQLLQQ